MKLNPPTRRRGGFHPPMVDFIAKRFIPPDRVDLTEKAALRLSALLPNKSYILIFLEVISNSDILMKSFAHAHGEIFASLTLCSDEILSLRLRMKLNPPI